MLSLKYALDRTTLFLSGMDNDMGHLSFHQSPSRAILSNSLDPLPRTLDSASTKLELPCSRHHIGVRLRGNYYCINQKKRSSCSLCRYKLKHSIGNFFLF